MQHLTPDALLRAWETGLAQREPPARARVLLGLACPHLADDERRALPWAERDRRLLDLRTAAFGAHFAGVTECSQCRATLELSFDAADLAPDKPAGAAEIEVRSDGYAVRCRQPCVADVEGTAAGALELRRAQLLQRLITQAVHDGQPCAPADLPAAVLDVVDAALEEASAGLAAIDLQCDVCGHRWNPPFDPAAYLWGELDAWAGRLLWEVNALARAYGWSERDLLSMSPWRRDHYLRMLAS